MTNQTVKILGWIYGRLEARLMQKVNVGIVNPEERPITSFTMIHKLAIQQRILTDEDRNVLAELLDEIPLDEFESVSSPESVIPLEQQGVWQLAYAKGKTGSPLSPGYQIAKHRESVGMTQKELAKALGVSQPAVAKWEARKTTPSIPVETIRSVIDAFGKGSGDGG